MSPSDAILEQWIARTVQSYPQQTTPLLLTEEDPFRNPVGHTLRTSLAILLRELLGDMDADAIAPALDAVIRIRALQDFSASQAAGFVFLLKPILRQQAPQTGLAELDDRVDRLALMAFDTYVRCRDQLADIRAHESRRALGNRQHVG